MTVDAKPSIKIYNEDGVTTSFAAPFRYLDPTDLVVERLFAAGVVTEIPYGTGFTATDGSTDDGGTVTVLSVSAGTRLRISRATKRNQGTAYETSGRFPAKTTENDLDRSMLISQEQDDARDALQTRALLAPDGETGTVIPSVASRSNKVFYFDSDGNPTALTISLLGLGSIVDGLGTAADIAPSQAAVTGGLALKPNVISPRRFGAVFDGVADDTVAWVLALALAGLTGGTVIFDGFASLIASAERLVIASGVSVFSDSRYEGGDGALSTSLPTINFSSGSGGFTMMPRASMAGIALFGAGANLVDHLIEARGQIGLSNVRLYVGLNGVLASKHITPGVSVANVDVPGSGLVNGVYAGVAFTGAGATAARVTVTVSGGAIASVVPSVAGDVSAPYFLYSFAAGALYAGSPALANVGGLACAPMGRSRIRNLFMIGSASAVIGLEVDGAFDFTDIDNVHWFNTGGVGSSKALRIGRVDGLGMLKPKIFGANIAISLEQPSADAAHPFGSIVAPDIDGCVLGITSSSPIQALAITGGSIRTVGRCLTINNPQAGVTVSAVNMLSQADITCQLIDFKLANINGNNFRSDTTGYSFSCVYISGSAGTGKYIVAGNGCDGNHPFVLADAAAKGGIIAPNLWPGRNYAAVDGGGAPTPGYVSSPNLSVNKQLPTVGDDISIVAGAADNVIAHGLGCIPRTPSVELIGTGADVNKAIITGKTTENISVRIVKDDGSGARITAGSFDLQWRA